MFYLRKRATIHPLLVQNYIKRGIAFHSSLASQSTAHKIKYCTKDAYGGNKSYHRSTEVEGFEELNLSCTIISFHIPSIVSILTAFQQPAPFHIRILFSCNVTDTTSPLKSTTCLS